MRILIVGHADTYYVKDYIENVLMTRPGNEIILAQESAFQHVKYLEYYQAVGVILEPLNQGFLNLVYRIPKVRSKLGSWLWSRKMIRKYGHFDLVHIQAVNVSHGNIALGLRKAADKMIMTIWGSELLRNSPRVLESYRRYYEIADCITFNSWGPYGKFADFYGKEFEPQMCVNHLSFGVLDSIDKALERESREDIRKRWKIGTDGSKIVFVGHNGVEAQQHLKITKALATLPQELKKQIILLYTMTYGVKNEKYLAQVERAAEQTGCRYVILKKFLYKDEVAELRLICDVLIHAQTTDAYAGSIMESLYAGAVVMNASWLRYKDLPDCEHRVVEFASIEEIPEKLAEVIRNYDFYRNRFTDMKEVIYAINGRETTTREWLNTLDRVCEKKENT